MWWTNVGSAGTTIANLTSTYYSPILIEDEIKAASDNAGSDEDSFRIKASLSQAEVSAKYVAGEINMVLSIKLPK
jgi:hypothetical protein